MATMLAEIAEIRRTQPGGETLLGLAFPDGAPAPLAGQYWLASARGEDAMLPTTFYPAGAPDAPFTFLPFEPVNWQPGAQLALRGPLGRGFDLPSAARQVALVALAGSSARLLPLAHQALDRGASVVLHSAAAPTGLPLDVEILPLDALAETLAWADYLALDVAREALPALSSRLGLAPFQRLPVSAEALLLASMPCAGVALCGVCALRTRAGTRYACKDGPVFDLHELLESGLAHARRRA